MIMLLVLSSQTTIELASVNLFDESRWYPLHNKDAMAAAAQNVSTCIPLVDPLGERYRVYEWGMAINTILIACLRMFLGST